MRKSFKNLIVLSFFLTILIPLPKIQAESFVKKIRESFDNFCAVEPNKLYRSKQLSGKRLDFYIKKYGIKTIYSYCNIENIPSQRVMKKIGMKQNRIFEENGKEKIVYSKIIC